MSSAMRPSDPAGMPAFMRVHVSPAFAVKSVRELIALAQAKPGVINFSSSGAGSTAHLMAVLFESLTGVRMTHVPYKGSVQARVAVMSRECDLMFDGLLATLPLIKAQPAEPADSRTLTTQEWCDWIKDVEKKKGVGSEWHLQAFSPHKKGTQKG